MIVTPSSSSSSSKSSIQRGAFILLEGVDRCGKTTQCSLLLKHLLSLSIASIAMRFPDRTTHVGTLIDSYLKSGNDLDDRAIHLLFSANRWEAVPTLAQALSDGKTVICDRYAYSGVAFSSAKTKADRKSSSSSTTTTTTTTTTLTNTNNIHDDDLSIQWCMSPDKGLPAPDAVLFLDLSQEESEKRGGFGGERYEKRDLQIRVRQRFSELQLIDEEHQKIPWYLIDASKSVEDVQSDINQVVQRTLTEVNEGKPLYQMFQDGIYHLPQPSNEISSNDD